MRQFIFLTTVTIAVLITHSAYYYPFLSDDALISLRYAARLISGDGLTWNDNEFVEGYSNLLWILLNSSIAFLGVDLIISSRLLGFICIFAVPILFFYHKIFHHQQTADKLLFGALFYSLSAPVAVWSIGGLEQPLLMLLFAVSILLLPRIYPNPQNHIIFALSFTLALMILTRPDSPIFVAAAAFSVLFIRSNSTFQQRLILISKIISIPLIFFVGQIFFRINYYDDILPNTAYVKITPSGNHFINGIEYVFGALLLMLPYSLIALNQLFAYVKRRDNVLSLYLFFFLALYLPYLIFIGGDVFPAYRHMTVVIVAFFALILNQNNFNIEINFLKRDTFKRKPFQSLLLISFVLIFFALQLVNTASRRAKHERWEWIGKELALTLKEAFSEEKPTIAVTAAGSIPYWSELPSIDMLGLNDKYIARNRPNNIGDGMLGHELGDGDYIINREPDLIVFNVGNHPTFRPGKQLEQMSEFHEQYKPIIIRLNNINHSAKIYFRLNSPRVGMFHNDDMIVIPSYLFADTVSVFSEMDSGSLKLRLLPQQCAELKIPKLNGKYIVETNSIVDGLSQHISYDSLYIRLAIQNLYHDTVYVDKIILKKISNELF